MKVFAIGNGKSRLSVNLHCLRQHGAIVGCNALYRDFTPDFLIAADSAMINEIVEAGYHEKYPVLTTNKSASIANPRIKFIPKVAGWPAGPAAIFCASEFVPTEVYLIGFDFSGDSGKVNNVYAGTQNYVDADSVEVYYANWLNQIETIVKKTPYITYKRVTSDNYYKLGWKYKNFQEITLETFDQIQNSWDTK